MTWLSRDDQDEVAGWRRCAEKGRAPPHFSGDDGRSIISNGWAPSRSAIQRRCAGGPEQPLLRAANFIANVRFQAPINRQSVS